LDKLDNTAANIKYHESKFIFHTGESVAETQFLIGVVKVAQKII